MEKEGKISDKFGQVRTSQYKATNYKNGEKGRKNKKREKNLSGNWEGGGESRV